MRSPTRTHPEEITVSPTDAAPTAPAPPTEPTAPPGRPVALLLPGQGAQQPCMAAGLYGHEPSFTAAMDTVFELLGARGRRLRRAWLAGPDDADPMFDDVVVAQPLLYAVDHALGRMLLDWGLRPGALLGHSVGEMAAGTLAGVFRLEDGVRLMVDRVEAFADSPPGGMLAVAAAPSDVQDLLGDGVVVGAVNDPRQIMLAGPARPLAAAAAALRERGTTCRPVLARQGFHSPMLAAAAEGSVPAWRAAGLRAPTGPLWSAYRPGPLPAATARDPRFWARQPAAPVRYGPALDMLLDAGDWLLVEAGPGQSLSTLARRHPRVRIGASAVVPLLPLRPGLTADLEAVRAAAARLAHEGHPLPRTP